MPPLPLPLLPDDPPRAAYVHVPFCRHRCGYCNFTLIAGRDDLVDDYLKALEGELAGLDRCYELDTLFFGGGTPTHLPVEPLRRLFERVYQRFSFAPHAEISVEANPLDLNAERAAVLRDFGVNRISLGVQSFQDDKLRFLERDHRRHDITQALEIAHSITNRVSLDLIFAAPGETLENWLSDIHAALATGVGHISTYGLTIEPGTAFYGRLLRGGLQRSPDTLEADMYEQAINLLTTNGFEHYEVSNFSRQGEHSRHNQTYWRGRSYFAFGPGAARYVGGRREINHRSTTTYIQRMLSGLSPVAESESLSPEDRAREHFVFGMRMLAGIHPGEFQAETGYNLSTLAGKAVEDCLQQHLLEWRDERLRLTRAGLLVSDSLWPRFLRT